MDSIPVDTVVNMLYG